MDGGMTGTRTPTRTALVERSTKESEVRVELDLDGSGEATSDTGVGFFDHMVMQLGKHGGFDLHVLTKGDVHVDSHHTVEDTALAIGTALREALGDKAGIRRFASGLYPLDEALVEVALDLSGRPFVVYECEFPGPLDPVPLGTPPFDPQLGEHFWQSFATAAGITLHVTKKRGDNTHHVVEAAFKGVARCLRAAVRIDGADLPSTKGVL